MCSKVLNGHIILTDTSITTILAPEMTYTPILIRLRCMANWQASGKGALAAPNGGTHRISVQNNINPTISIVQ